MATVDDTGNFDLPKERTYHSNDAHALKEARRALDLAGVDYEARTFLVIQQDDRDDDAQDDGDDETEGSSPTIINNPENSERAREILRAMTQHARIWWNLHDLRKVGLEDDEHGKLSAYLHAMHNGGLVRRKAHTRDGCQFEYRIAPKYVEDE